MPSTYLQIVQTACAELGLNKPSTVIGSSDKQIVQLSALMNRDLRELQQNYDWTALQTEFDLSVAQPTQTTGDVTIGSTTLANIGSVPSSLQTDPQLWLVSGQNIPVNTRCNVYTGGGSPTITMSQPATGTLAGEAIQFSQDTYPGPIDFDRFIGETWWDRTNRWALLGPDSPQIDQWHRSGIVTIGPRRHFRQIGYNSLTQATAPVKNYRIWPAPGATDTPINIAYEYISAYSVLSSTLVPQPNFQADTDFPILDENMLILGAKWRLWQIKGFDYAAMQQEYIDYCDRHYANDGGMKTLSMAKTRAGLFGSLVQDGNFPGPTSSGF